MEQNYFISVYDITAGLLWEHAVGFLLDLLKPNNVDIVNVIDEFLCFALTHLHERSHR